MGYKNREIKNAGNDVDNGLEELDRIDSGFKLSRRHYVTKDKKKSYWLYYLDAKMRNKEIEISFGPKGTNDLSAYDVLDMIFEDNDEPTIYIIPYSYKNDKKEDVKGYNYEVVLEEDGLIIMKCKIKPQRESDKSLWEYLIGKLLRQIEAEQEAKAEAESAAENIVPDPEKPDKNKKG